MILFASMCKKFTLQSLYWLNVEMNADLFEKMVFGAMKYLSNDAVTSLDSMPHTVDEYVKDFEQSDERDVSPYVVTPLNTQYAVTSSGKVIFWLQRASSQYVPLKTHESSY